MFRSRRSAARHVFSLLILALGAAAAATADEPIEVRGIVLGPGGSPVAEARVTLLPLADPVAITQARLAGRTLEPASVSLSGSDGAYRLSAPRAGAWTIRVEAPGFAPRELRLAPLVEPVDLAPTELSPDAGLMVRVTDAAGEPVAGALVRLAPARSGRRRPGAARSWRTPPALGFTDGEGSVSLPRAEGERVSLGVSARGFAPVALGSVRGTSAAIPLEPAPALPIVVVDEDESPVAGALVSVGDDEIPLGFTSDAGSVIASLPRGEPLELRIAAAGGRETTRRETVVVGESKPLRLMLPAVWAVTGRIVDADRGTGIAGGVVYDAARPWVLAATGSGGAFTLGLSGPGRVRLVAAASGYLPDGGHEASRSSARLLPPAIPLRPAAAIAGVVLDEQDQPVVGARVGLEERPSQSGRIEIRLGDDPGIAGDALTGPDGRFRISRVDPEKSWRVVARADGFARSRVDADGLVPYETLSGLRITLARGRSLAGIVVDHEGRGIPGALLSARTASEGGPGMMMRLGGSGGGDSPAASTSGSDGVFAIEGLAPGRYDLTVTREGFARKTVPGVELSGDARTEPLRVELEPGIALSGRIANDTGEPIEGVEVSVTKAEGPMPLMMPPGMGGGEADAVTGPDGWFSVGGFADGDRVSASFSARGWARASRANVELPPPAPIEVTLQPASSLSGTVVDAEGNPVPGATIEMTQQMTSQMGGISMVIQMTGDTETEDDGTFLMENLEPGEVILEARAFGHGTVKRTLRIPEGEDVEEVELPLPPGAVVTGQVLLSDGRPAVGVRVSQVEEGAERFGGSAVATDADGRYLLEGLEPGLLSIEAVGEGRQRTVREIDVEAGINDLDLRFEGGVELSGTVLGADGSPLQGALVRLVEPGRDWGGPERRAGQAGRFSFDGILPGDYRVFASHEDHAPGQTDAPVTVQREPVSGVVVRLGRGATITGSVRGLDERELPRVSVTAFGPGLGSLQSARVDHQGTFRIEHAQPGRWELRGRVGSEGRQATAEVTVSAEGSEVVADLVFGQGVVLRGTVLQDERPVSGATIFVEGLDAPSSGWSSTDSEGRFVLDGLEEGRFRVAIRSWDTGLSHTEEIDVYDGREVLISVPTTRISGRVVDAADGEPIAGARLSLLRAGEASAPGSPATLGTTTDVDGRFVIAPVTDGDWELAAEKPGFAVERLPVTVASGSAPSDVTVRLGATEGITLLVRLPSGRPAAEVDAAVLDAAGGVLTNGRYATGENGKLRIRSIPPGSWRAVLSAAGSGTLSTTVSAPGAPTAIDLPAATSLIVRVPALAEEPSPARMRIATADGTPFTRLEWFGTPTTEWPAGAETTVERLPPGRYTITVTAADGRAYSGSITTTAAARAELVLE